MTTAKWSSLTLDSSPYLGFYRLAGNYVQSNRQTDFIIIVLTCMVRGEEKGNLVVYIVMKRARAFCQQLYYFYNSQLILHSIR